MNAVTPRLGAGLKDYLPKEMIARQRMLDTIRKVFEGFGFVPLDTPGLEQEKILTGGDPSFNKQIFRARLRDGDEGLALRFDLTVPLARVIAQYPGKISRPFKRYQCGKVWRGEKPQDGRYREFVQFDVDIVGCADCIADAEIVAVIYETMTALGIKNFLIKVNNRKVLNGLPEYLGFSPELTPDVLRLIDKVDTLGWENVAGELSGQKFGFSPDQLNSLKLFLDFRGSSQRETIAGVRGLMNNSSVALTGIDELEEIADNLEALGVPPDKWTIDLSVARGLGYYTGPVFETVLTDLPSIGSVFSGGRFDDLVSRFNPASVPATGASVGVDRLFAAMVKLGLVKSGERSRRTVAQVLVLNFDSDCKLVCQSVATLLRRAGISTEIYMGKEINLKGQLAFAVREQIPVVLIIGGNEKANGAVTVKDMVYRRQYVARVQDVVKEVQTILLQTAS